MKALKHRIFIAINLPQNIKQKLVDLILNLQKINPVSGIKWIKPEGLHITLHFLGYLDEKQIEKVKEVMDSIIGVSSSNTFSEKCWAKQRMASELRFTGINGFPDMNRPRIVFAEIEEIDNNNLIRLQQSLGQDLEKAGFQIDHRPWHPHITLARIKIPRIKLRVADCQLPITIFQIKSIDLMESELRRDGAKYKVLSTTNL